MSNQKEKVFADGFRFERRDNAPEFVVGRMSIKVDEAITFLKSNEKRGWVNLNILTGRSGNPYVELDTFEPKGSTYTGPNKQEKQPPMESFSSEELPF